MTRTRLTLAVALALVAVGLDVGLGPPAGRINIRWADEAQESDRARLEADLRLTAPRLQEGRTWSYDPRDASRENIERLVRHPLVADTHNIDRFAFSIARDPSGTPGWIRAVNRLPIIRRVTRLYPQAAAVLAIVGLVAAWPAVRHAIPRTRSAITALARMASPRRAVLAIVLASVALRVVLVWSGGQFYWPDEGRYDHARKIVQEAVAGQYGQALVRLDSPDHLFFKILGIIPATVEYLVRYDTRIPGLFFSIFSVLNIWLVGRIARRLGASAWESAMASGLVALSSAFFYYARHLIPYDVAFTWALLAMYVGVSRRPGIWSSVACGVLAACTFYTYAGYWTLSAAVLLIHVIDATDVRDALRRALWSSLAAAATVGLVLAINAVSGGHLLALFIKFASTINQGDVAEGWSFPFEYLWHAEHALLLAWIAAAVYWIVRMRRAVHSRRVRLALAGLCFIYGTLAISSTALHAFVVYARLARQLVPFFCLVTAAALEELRVSESATARRLVSAMLLLLVAQAAFNFWAPLRQTFPSEFLQEADDVGQNEIPGVMGIYTRHIYPAPEPFTLPAGYAVLKEARHPLQYLPYQYEGYDPGQRQVLRSTDIRMRLIAPAPERRAP